MKWFSGLMGLLLYAFILLPAVAELQLPSAQDRRPNLSMDPFERAREAIKRLPPAGAPAASAPVEKAPRDVPREAPPIESTQQSGSVEATAPVTDGGGDEPRAFSQEFILTGDYFTLINGGDIIGVLDETAPVPPNSAALALVEYTAEVSTSALNLWDDGSFFVHAFGFLGNTATAILGDFHGLSSVDAGAETTVFRLWEAWYEHNFPYNKSSFLLGVHDFNSEFYVLEFANLFMNGAFGLGTELGASAGPSTFPTTTLGFRFRTQLRENAYFQLGVYDGTPGPMEKFFDVAVSKDEGTFTVGEVGFFAGEVGAAEYYKVAVGGWYFRRNLEYYTGAELAEGATPPGQFEHPVPGTNGVYLLAETAIGANMGLFVKAGWADPLYNRYSVFYSAGLNYSGLIPGRADDVLGIGAVQSRQGSNFLGESIDETTGEPAYYSAETTFEVTYSARVLDWLMVQPDIQYVQQPNMDLTIKDAMLFGIRLQAVY